jgi:hypothetical protein
LEKVISVGFGKEKVEISSAGRWCSRITIKKGKVAACNGTLVYGTKVSLEWMAKQTLQKQRMLFKFFTQVKSRC